MSQLFNYITFEQLSAIRHSNYRGLVEITPKEENYIRENVIGLFEFHKVKYANEYPRIQYYLSMKDSFNSISINFNKTEDDWFYFDYALVSFPGFTDRNYIKSDQVDGFVHAVNYCLNLKEKIQNRYKEIHG